MLFRSVLFWTLLSSVTLAAEPRFEHVTLDDRACQVAVYAVTVADVDGDKLNDIVAITENRVIWYRNPDWKAHVIIEDQMERDLVCIAPGDVDGDGKVDFAIGAGWLNGRNLGSIYWITRNEDPNQKWSVHQIGAIPWTHRMRFGDVLGKGTPQLTVSPLNKTMGEGVDLTAFSVPKNPKTDMWPRNVINHEMNRMHNHWHLPNAAGAITTLTASQEGVHSLPWPGDAPIRIGTGASGPRPEDKGAGEVKPGKLKNGGRLIATIEPMHGHQAVVYLLPPGDITGPASQRIVLDDTLKQGHAIWPADFDGDGDDDVLAGFREPGTGAIKGPGLFLYENVDGQGETWKKHVIDNGGMAAEDVFVSDLDGDGLPEIIAGGRATKNLKLYRNVTPRP